VGESDGQLFLAMACYEGMTLREKLQEGPLPWAEAATLAMQAAQPRDSALRGSRAYRRALVQTLVRRALSEAAGLTARGEGGA